jgi:hypothetical protein
MPASSVTLPAYARNFEAEALRRIADVQLDSIADKFGCDRSTASRMFNERGLKLPEIAVLLNALGWKIVDQTKVCVPRDVFEAYKTLAKTALTEPHKLNWDAEE